MRAVGENSNDAQPQWPLHRAVGNRAKQRLHRIAAVRREQGISLPAAARKMRTTVAELKRQERSTCNLSLRQLYERQRILDVPVSDLLVDPGTPLSRPVRERAQLVRLMKTAMTLFDPSSPMGVRALAQTMIDQLVEMMPELKESDS